MPSVCCAQRHKRNIPWQAGPAAYNNFRDVRNQCLCIKRGEGMQYKANLTQMFVFKEHTPRVKKLCPRWYLGSKKLRCPEFKNVRN